MKKQIVFQLLVIALFAILPVSSFPDEENYFDIGVGAGTDFQGTGAKQLLLAPAYNVPIPAHESLRLRIEADMEFIDDRSKTIFVGGVAPFIRILPFSWNVKPFVEFGAGANLSTNREIGNQNVDGPFMFSLMSGVGVGTMINKTPVSLSYRFRHLSNAGIYEHNEGFNSQYIMLSVGF